MKHLDTEGTLQNEALCILHRVDPTVVDYNQWFGVGAALKGCGCAVKDWDDWSKLDPRRYHAGECERKWEGMKGTGIGALYALLSSRGTNDTGQELGWNDSLVAVGEAGVGDTRAAKEDPFNASGESKDETIRHLRALFGEDEIVAYVNRFSDRGNGKLVPANKGHYDRTLAELIRDLEASSDIGGALGDYTPEAGALVRINPMDGNGVGDANVAAHKYALVECDAGSPERQVETILQLRLSVAVMAYSGNKSVHAAVRVDADGPKQYHERVAILYDYCTQHNLEVDLSCKNPSRMMRLAGVTRKGVRQTLIATNVGCSSWDEWYEWVTGSAMPEIVNLGSIWHRLPPLAPEMIEGTLRVGHKMLVAGPSKAGKSFLLIQLAVAVAEGSTWLGRRCKQGRVLYVNLEVDHASCLHRFEDVYAAMKIPPNNVGNIDIYSLRGHAQPLDKLVPKVLETCDGTEYTMVILDPIYKIITGDENNATDMAYFVAQLDVIADRLDCCVVYAHHHSKGRQGWKYASDRMSGSGVFARDPDAILDMSPITCSDEQRLAGYAPAYRRLVSSAMVGAGIDTVPDHYSLDAIERWARRELPNADADALIAAAESVGPWDEPPEAYRISFTLREFRSPKPTDVWYTYPVHVVDDGRVLSGCRVDGEPGRPKLPKPSDEQKDDPFEDIEFAFALVSMGEPNARIQDLADWLGVSVKTAQRRLDKDGRFERANGLAWLKVV